MKYFKIVIILLLVLTFKSYGGEKLNDPYEILNKHYEAIGGLEKHKAIKTSYMEGKMVIQGTGLEGTLKKWRKEPLQERQEVDLKIMKQLSGDNGEYSWTVDSNGKLQIMKDESTIKARKIKKLESEYDYLDPKSENFTITFEGIDKIEETPCYKLKTTNNINEEVVFDFYNTSNFLLEKSIRFRDNMEIHSALSDYRPLEYGITVAFKTEQTILPRGQKTIIQLEKYEINLPLADDFFEPPQEDIADFEFENGESAENIPFEYIEDHIFLKVKLNGTNGIWVLDSGAGSSVIDKGYAKKMGLEIQGNVKGQGVSNTVDVSFTTLPPFSLKGINFKEQQIITMDFKWLFDKTTDLEVVGILGYDFLSRLTTKIDYANQLISFYHPEKFSYSGEGVVIDTPLDNNLPTVPLTIDGKYSGMWRLDLGATGVSFHYPFAQENNLLDTPGIERISFGAGGEHISTLAKFQTAEMAGFTVKEPTLRIPQEKGEGAFSTKKYVGNIGNTFLRHFVVYLDYKNQQIILEKGDNYERIFPVDKSGLQLIYTDDKKIEVLNAAEGTPAREAGFKRGDIVQAINGIDVKYFAGIVKIRELLMENEGTEYEFKIIRNGNSKNVELELSEIF